MIRLQDFWRARVTRGRTEHATSNSVEETTTPTSQRVGGTPAYHEPSPSPNASAENTDLWFNSMNLVILIWIINNFKHAYRALVVEASKIHVYDVTSGHDALMVSPYQFGDKNPIEDQSVQLAMRALDNRLRVVAVAGRIHKPLSKFTNPGLFAPARRDIRASGGHCNRDQNDYRRPGIG